MKLRMLMFRAHIVYRLSMIADKVFNWGCKRHHELFKLIEGDLK